LKAQGATSVEKLFSVSSGPLALTPNCCPAMLDLFPLGSDLFRTLQQRNGFYAFESALHVFPIAASDCMSLEEWNATSLWRDTYKYLANDLLFFAEDAFQNQFALSATGVVRFESETAEKRLLANSIENWAAIILRDHRTETGWPLIQEWQDLNGPLAPGKWLMPNTPFFLGGEFSLSNLLAGDSVEGMRYKGDLAIQTRGLPDGAAIRLVVGKPPLTQ